MRTEEDVKLAVVVEALAADKERSGCVAEYRRRRREAPRGKFGSNGLKVRGKIFAMAVNGRLVVKLSAERAADLVATKLAEPYDPGHGRRMKQWVTLAPLAPAIDLAKEAHDYVKRDARP